ncbi:hypothetical protein ES708_23767 [subsurface metagenome]
MVNKLITAGALSKNQRGIRINNKLLSLFPFPSRCNPQNPVPLEEENQLIAIFIPGKAHELLALQVLRRQVPFLLHGI